MWTLSWCAQIIQIPAFPWTFTHFSKQIWNEGFFLDSYIARHRCFSFQTHPKSFKTPQGEGVSHSISDLVWDSMFSWDSRPHQACHVGLVNVFLSQLSKLLSKGEGKSNWKCEYCQLQNILQALELDPNFVAVASFSFFEVHSLLLTSHPSLLANDTFDPKATEVHLNDFHWLQWALH